MTPTPPPPAPRPPRPRADPSPTPRPAPPLPADSQPPAFDPCGPLPGPGVTVLEASAGTGKTFTIAALDGRFVAEGCRSTRSWP